MTALWFEGNSVRYGDISGLVDQSEVHVDVQVRGPSILVFSGGTAFNGVVEELKKLTTRVAHVLPISDHGGNTTEIVRALGTVSKSEEGEWGVQRLSSRGGDYMNSRNVKELTGDARHGG